MAKKMNIDDLDFYKNQGLVAQTTKGKRSGKMRKRRMKPVWGKTPEEKEHEAKISELIPKKPSTEVFSDENPPPPPPKIRTPMSGVKHDEPIKITKVNLQMGRSTKNSKLGTNNEADTRPESVRAKSDVSYSPKLADVPQPSSEGDLPETNSEASVTLNLADIVPPKSPKLKKVQNPAEETPPSEDELPLHPPPPPAQFNTTETVSTGFKPLEDPADLLAKLEEEYDGPGRFGTVFEPPPKPRKISQDVKIQEMKIDTSPKQPMTPVPVEVNEEKMESLKEKSELILPTPPPEASFELENEEAKEMKTAHVANEMLNKDKEVLNDFLNKPRATKNSEKSSREKKTKTSFFRLPKGKSSRKMSTVVEEKVEGQEFSFDKDNQQQVKNSGRRLNARMSSLDVFANKNALNKKSKKKKKKGVFNNV